MVLVPETRFEAFLAKIAGQEGPDLEPITRTEAFLDDIADGENNLEPRTRLEYWLQKIAERPSGGANLMQATITNRSGHGTISLDNVLVLRDGDVCRGVATEINITANATKVVNMAMLRTSGSSNAKFFFGIRNSANSNAITAFVSSTNGVTGAIVGSVTSGTIRHTIVSLEVDNTVYPGTHVTAIELAIE